MSEERSAIVVGQPGSTKSEAEIIAEADEMTDDELHAHYAQILDRSIIVDRLSINLPPDVYGEWIKDDPTSITEAQMIGFKIDREHAPKSHGNLHDDGTGIARMGDVVFMTMPKRNKAIMDRVKAERVRSLHNPSAAREEKEYAASVRGDTAGEISTFADSSLAEAGATEIEDALKALNAQKRG